MTRPFWDTSLTMEFVGTYLKRYYQVHVSRYPKWSDLLSDVHMRHTTTYVIMVQVSIWQKGIDIRKGDINLNATNKLSFYILRIKALFQPYYLKYLPLNDIPSVSSKPNIVFLNSVNVFCDNSILWDIFEVKMFLDTRQHTRFFQKHYRRRWDPQTLRGEEIPL